MNKLRPNSLKDFVGQSSVIAQLNILIQSAKERNDHLPHILLDGGPGLGKTSLAVAVAQDMGVPIQTAIGGDMKSLKNVLPYLFKLTEKSILFIDEVHRLPKWIEEILYPVMEDFKLTISKEDRVSFDLPNFTLIGATTEAGSLATPFHDRFVFKTTLEIYQVDELSRIIASNASKLDLKIDQAGINAIARCSRGTPRIANNLLTWTRDFAVANRISCVTIGHVDSSLKMLGIDKDGKTKEDNVYLTYVKKHGPVGVNTISSGTGIDLKTIVHTIEPFLLRLGLIRKTGKGRIVV